VAAARARRGALLWLAFRRTFAIADQSAGIAACHRSGSVTSNDDAHAKAAAKQLGASLQKSGAFASVTAELPPFDLSQIAALYLPYRFGLLTPADRATLAQSSALNASLRDALAQRIYSPLRGALSTSLADDPFGWLEHWLGGLPLATSNLRPSAPYSARSRTAKAR
jgi:predicted exporter